MTTTVEHSKSQDRRPREPSCDGRRHRRRRRSGSPAITPTFSYASIQKDWNLRMFYDGISTIDCRHHNEFHGSPFDRRCTRFHTRRRIDIVFFHEVYYEHCCSSNNLFQIRPRFAIGAKRIRCHFHTLLFTILLILSVEASNPTYSLCYSQLSQADTNGDGAIDSAEFEMFIGLISGGTVVPDALDRAALFTTAGGTDTIDINAVKDSASNNAFCQSIYESVLTASSMQLDTSESKCLYAMSIGDANRDSALARFVEYPRYANQVSGNIFGFSTSYEELPEVVQTVFDEFVDDTSADTINIIGAKSSEALTPEQALELQMFCQHTAIAILAANGNVDTPLSTPIEVPVVAPPTSVPISAPLSEAAPLPAPTASTGTTSPVVAPVAAPIATGNMPIAGVPDGFIPSFTITVCLQKIAFSDSSRDNTLSSSEYYAFLNRLTEDAFSEYGSFANLPESLQNSFASLAGGSESGTVNVYGSKPGQTASLEDTERLDQFCTATDAAIQEVLANNDAGATPVASPAVATNPIPIAASNLSYDDCLKTMIVADLSRDSLLNDKEFVRFLSRLDDSIQESDEFSALHQTLQDLFTALAVVDGEIDVTGSKPNETPSPEQNIHLESVCSQVGAALAALETSSTIAPTNNGAITIYNSFVISNSVKMTASTLKSNQVEWDGINQAYSLFAQNTISNFTKTNLLSRELLRQLKSVHIRRRLPVTGIVKDSPRIYLIDDVTCPINVNEGDVCQIAFASFDAEYVDLNQENVMKTLTNYTQNLLDTYLEELLLLSNPNSVIRIAGLYDILRPPENSTSPPMANGSDDSGDEGDGPSVVKIIGGLVILSILIGCAVYYWKTIRNKGKPKTRKSDTNRDSDCSDDREDDNAYRVESAPPIVAKSPFDSSVKKNHDLDDDHSSDDDESNELSEENHLRTNDEQGKPELKKFKTFRLGKKRDSHVEDDIGVLESNDDHPDGVDDFGNYEFEEPIETWGHQDVDNDWGKSQWGMTKSGGQNRVHVFDSLAVSPNPTKNHDGNEDTEYSGSSESSGSNSAVGNSSVISGASGNVGQLGGLVDNGQWNGVLQTAAQLENNLTGSVSSHNTDSRSCSSSKSATETSFNGDDVNDFVDDPFDDRTHNTGASMTSEEQRRREAYRVQIEDLVRKTAPDEIGNVKNMMDQFIGREAELINTLQTMYERSLSQSRLKAVHKSKAIRERDPREFTSGGAESSAVIAAASMINGEEDVEVFDDEGDFGDDSYYDDGNLDETAAETMRYDDNDNNGMKVFDFDNEDDPENDERSYYSRSYRDDDDSRSRSRSYDEGSRSQSGSYDDGSRSRSGSYDDDQEDSAYQSQGEQYDDEFEGSGSGSRTGSYNDKDGFEDFERSFTGSRSGSGSKERSVYVYDDGDGSYYSNEE